MNTIGIITYKYKHLKTEQVVTRLANMGYNLVLYALPFHYRTSHKALFSHRPDQFTGMHTQELASKYSIPYMICKNDQDIKAGCDVYLLTGAGILSNECIKDKIILNCHPGIIPIERGLDAFKWGIYDLKPIGNTLYIINQDVDLGEIIKIKRTPLYREDTIGTFATRHYLEEINMLVDFQIYLNNKDRSDCCVCNSSEIEPIHRRMPKDIEQQMLQRFARYKEKYAEKRR